MYQIEPGRAWFQVSRDEGEFLYVIDQQRQDVGELVPVEPDYEAAAKALVDREWTDIFYDLAPYEQRRAIAQAKRIVDAALGVSDE